MREIQLTQGYKALVSEEDYARVSPHNWLILKVKRKDGTIIQYYARAIINGKQILLHRFIWGLAAESPVRLDHVDQNGLHCYRENLRPATRQQNAANVRSRYNSKISYKGVIYDTSGRTRKPYRAQITIGRKHFSLGRFSTPEQAARRYDEEARKAFGEFACLNFPNKEMRTPNEPI
jgi:hypothetical protein